jgi:hypothetical protein
MSDRRDIEKELGRLTVPDPGELVRSRALAAGRRALARQTAPDVWERIWSSRAFRLAWTAAVLLLVAGHLTFRVGPAATVELPGYVERMLGSDANEELVAGLVLPPLDPDAPSRGAGLRD